MAMTWRPTPELAEQLRITAFVMKRPISDLVTEAVADWLVRHEPTEAERLAAVRAQTRP